MRGKNRRQEQESSVLKLARGNNGEKNERETGEPSTGYKMSIAAPFNNKTFFCLYRIPELPIWFFKNARCSCQILLNSNTLLICA